MRQLGLLPLVVCLCAAAGAQVPDVPAQQTAQHIATVNFNAVVIQTAEAQRDFNALQAKLAPRQTALKALNDEVESSRKQLQSAADNLSDAERAARTQSLEGKERQLQRQADDFKNDSQTESQQVFQRVAQKVFAFLQTYAQQHGYSAVIERGSETAPIVWYAGVNVDITEDLIKVYDSETGVPSTQNRPAHRSSSDSSAPTAASPRQR